MSGRKCTRCGEGPAEFTSGPLLGLCRTCIENDHVGMAAQIEVLRKENAGLRERLEDASADDSWRRGW